MKKSADPYLAREAWLNIVKPVEMAGRLDHVKATPATNSRERKTRDIQNHYLTRRSMGIEYSEGQFERIFGHG